MHEGSHKLLPFIYLITYVCSRLAHFKHMIIKGREVELQRQIGALRDMEPSINCVTYMDCQSTRDEKLIWTLSEETGFQAI